EFEFKRSTIQGNRKFLLVIGSSYKWALRQNCQRLQDTGFNITTLEVANLLRHETSQDVVAPVFQTIGRVKRIEGDQALVETNEGDKTYLLKNLYLNKTYENIR